MAMAKRLNKEDFLEKAIQIHGKKYDYSKVEYVNNKTKVIITCPIHGNFEQTPKNHLLGQGCPLCGIEKIKESSKNNYGGLLSLSKQRFNDEYEFPNIKDEYENSHSIITIKHKPCGTIFQKIAGDHLTSKYGGCPCLRKYDKPKLSIEEKIQNFLNNSLQRFGDVYEYPNIEKEYKDVHSVITIKHKTCDTVFYMKVKIHLSSKNGRCPCFQKPKQICSLEQFISSFNKVNDKLNNQFTCPFEEYTNQNTPIQFHCNECGNTFERKPTVFIYMNHTCPYCNNKNRNRTYSTDEFINKANEIHYNQYDYSKTEYKGSDKKICVICHKKDEFGEEHGEFYVTPHSHIGKMQSGCPKCAKKFGSKERFIKLANHKFNNFYDYSLVDYKNALTDVKIICPIHGIFDITPNEHLTGRGCPHCQESKMEHIVRTLLLDNNIDFEFQKRFDWLKPLSLDFYLPQYNIAIECQGGQHFKPIDFFGGEEKYKRTVEYDTKKKELCQQHSIKLLYFSNLNIEYPYEVITNTETLLENIC